MLIGFSGYCFGNSGGTAQFVGQKIHIRRTNAENTLENTSLVFSPGVLLVQAVSSQFALVDLCFGTVRQLHGGEVTGLMAYS